jgi:hypothetical protein
MTTTSPFSLSIHFANGDFNGLKIISLSGSSSKAVMFPRESYMSVRSRPEFKKTGVYLLFGLSSVGNKEMLYIGEGDPVLHRLDAHNTKKDFWTKAIFFVDSSSDQINKAHVQYLEFRLVALAAAVNRVELHNGTKPTEPTLSEADRASMDSFLRNILGILSVLGISAFEQSPISVGMPIDKGRVISPPKSQILKCIERGANADGYDTPQGFVVMSGSLAMADEVPSLKNLHPIVAKLRADLTREGVLIPDGNRLRFTQDYTFNSPSLAGAVVKGNGCSGLLHWKDSSGRTLKQLQAAQVKG